MNELTPVMKQYTDIKKRYPDALILFRLGDFYEMFGTDAEEAAPILNIALTTRDRKKENPLPMCGVPYHAIDTYLKRLIDAGRKVAVCEQMENPADVKGIVARDVVRVITPGTFEPDEPKENKYILSFVPSGQGHGIAVSDISTGDLFVFESDKPLMDEIFRFKPGEVICPESLKGDIFYSHNQGEHYTTYYDNYWFDHTVSYKTLLEYFKVSTLDGFGLYGMSKSIISAAGGLVKYLIETQKSHLNLKGIRILNTSDHMFLDASAIRNLELFNNLKNGSSKGTLVSVIDHTLTPMGGRLLRDIIARPLINKLEIEQRLDGVTILIGDYELIESIRQSLKNVSDLERLSSSLMRKTISPRDLMAIRNSVEEIAKLKIALEKSWDDTHRSWDDTHKSWDDTHKSWDDTHKSWDDTHKSWDEGLDPFQKAHNNSSGVLIHMIRGQLSDFRDLAEIITNTISDPPPNNIKDGNVIKIGLDPNIDELKHLSTSGKKYLLELEERERAASGINLKIGYNRVFGYYFEVSKANIPLVPPYFIRKQTLVNGERYITEELKDYEHKILGAEERLKSLEQHTYLELIEKLAAYVPRLRTTSEAVGLLDLLQSMASVAKRNNYVKPEITDDGVINIIEGRHPVIEQLLETERFIPNDAVMDMETEWLLIITGPNMAGKSTFMRQTALIVLMAQIGSYVPAESATIGIVDRIFTRIGASDYLARGQSTFMVEMVETANIVNNATDKSLIILDEVGRGTSTFDGISIAWAVADYIASSIKTKTLFATHYNELTELSLTTEGVVNYNVTVKEWGDEIMFLHKIAKGAADKSYGIHVARLAGLPDKIIDRAREILSGLEKDELADTGKQKFTVTQKRSYKAQLDLFTDMENPVIMALAQLNLKGMKGDEALNVLKELKKNAVQ
ncbi:MAG: DNA mismatch repair protein MutS [Nitrospirae bacterium]|nr:DNA mismatch repair protein MutS [Nitrospirota bacterium]